MPRRVRIPTYRLHKQSGQAVVTLPDALGGRHDVLLGPYETPESRAEYLRVVAEWQSGVTRTVGRGSGGLSVNELILAFWRHAEQHYRHPDGSPTGEIKEYRLSLRPLKHLYGLTPAAEFGPLALKVVRDLMVQGYDHPEHGAQPPLCRKLINQRIGRVRRMFRWGVENELVPPATAQALQAVRGLQRGRSGARETEPVRAVAPDAVNETLPHLSRHVAGMVRVQLLSGARPGEVCVMRACDIDMTGKVWLYRPGSDSGPEGQHKTAHHGHQRVIALGPKAQEVVREFLTLDTRAYLFSPRLAIEERRAERRQQRKTRVQPSQQDRRKRAPKKRPGERYTVQAYAHAVAAACRRASLPHWHPHQLRHTAATAIRREAGLDVARVVLGHRSPQITELYAELDVNRAAEIMERLG